MSLRIITGAGTLMLGDAPDSAMSCALCGAAAQLVTDTPDRTIASCGLCVEAALDVLLDLKVERGAGG